MCVSLFLTLLLVLGLAIQECHADDFQIVMPSTFCSDDFTRISTTSRNPIVLVSQSNLSHASPAQAFDISFSLPR